jgi:hypothetical protein
VYLKWIRESTLYDGKRHPDEMGVALDQQILILPGRGAQGARRLGLRPESGAPAASRSPWQVNTGARQRGLAVGLLAPSRSLLTPGAGRPEDIASPRRLCRRPSGRRSGAWGLISPASSTRCATASPRGCRRMATISGPYRSH